MIAFPFTTGTLRPVETESHDTPKCQNCGTHLAGRYCPECGQRDYDFNRSFGEIAAELAESFWNFDTKLFRGVFDLLFRPGFLTIEFLAGRRARQVPPLRFYLFVSILFFLANSFEPSGDLFAMPKEGVSFDTLGLDPARTAKVKAAAANTRLEAPDPTERRIIEFLRERFERQNEIARMIGEHLPKLVFACLPVFALITRVVFRRARRGYLSHLVMAMHLHSFYFLFTPVLAGWVLLLGLVSTRLASLGSFAGVLYLLAYCYLAAKKVFGTSRAGTFWRVVVTGGLYSIALGLGFIAFILTVTFLA